MTRKASICCLGNIICLFALLGAAEARAEDVRMFQHVPSVAELRNTLAAPKTKHRGIIIGDQPAASTTPKAAPPAIGLPVAFGYDSAQLLLEARPYLDQVGRLMQEDKALALLIEGHTDATGSTEYNKDLSERRASSVRQYLIGEYGIDPARLPHVGRGKSVPLNVENPLAAENRRVQFRRVDTPQR